MTEAKVLRSNKSNARRPRARESSGIATGCCSSSCRGGGGASAFTLSLSDLLLLEGRHGARATTTVKLDWKQKRPESLRRLVACEAAINRSSASVQQESSTSRKGAEELEQIESLQKETQRLHDLLLCLKGRDAKDQVVILKKEIAAANKGAKSQTLEEIEKDYN